MDLARVQRDFDEIARLNEQHGGTDRHEAFLLSLVPHSMTRVLDFGCGTGRLAAQLAREGREVLGVDLSPEMIRRARERATGMPNVCFLCGDFLTLDLTPAGFDCIITAAALHHVDTDLAVARMKDLLRRGGRLIIHDLRTTSSVVDETRALAMLAGVAALRLLRTGSPWPERRIRDAWARHGASETYLTFDQAGRLAAKHLPGAHLHKHWMWRYTIVWDAVDGGQVTKIALACPQMRA